MRFAKTTLMASLLAGLLGSCAVASNVELIDRTSPNKVAKSLFKGEWFFRVTIVDAQFNQGMFEGYQGEMDRVRWEITEGFLTAYRSNEMLIGAEEGTGSVDFQGNVVARYAISSHFDVQRGLNYATGEQDNVLGENTTDRPWYERQHMRVDWSSSVQMDPVQLGNWVHFRSGGRAFYTQGHEAESPNRPEITADNINIVGNFITDTDWGVCFANADTFFSFEACNASETKLKYSFMRIKGDRTTEDGRNLLSSDYAPLYYPDVVPIRMPENTVDIDSCYSSGVCNTPNEEVFSRFGYFRSERLSYDSERRYTRNGRLFVGHRWNIWAQTHDAVTGEVIDAGYRTAGKYEYRADGSRKLVPAITYYTNVDFPEVDDDNNAAWDASVELVAEWDLAMRTTVAALKQTRLDNPDTRTIDEILPEIGTVFSLERNTCNIENVNQWAKDNGYVSSLRKHGITTVARGNINKACAVLEYYSNGDFTWQKFGDLRYSFLNWVDTPSARGPLGYGPSSSDPITGEIISANANIYGPEVNGAAAYAADLVLLMNGDLEDDEIMNGELIRNQIEGNRDRFDQALDPNKMNAYMDKLLAARSEIFGGRVPQMNQLPGTRTTDPMNRSFASREEVIDSRATGTVATDGLDRIKGTPLEDKLFASDDLRRAMIGPQGYQDGSIISDELGDFSPIQFMQDLDTKKDILTRMAKDTIFMWDNANFADAGMVHVADEMSGKTWDEVYKILRKRTYKAVMAHEVGHTVGLRHNFTGSNDALNYHKEFWDYFNPTTGKVEKIATAGNLGEPTVGKATRAGRLQYSSIMDYSARFFADDIEGIGPYDKAAIKFGYGGILERFEQDAAMPAYSTMLYLYDYNDYPKIFSGAVDGSNADYTAANSHNNTARDHEDAMNGSLQDGDEAAAAQSRVAMFDEDEQSGRFFLSYMTDSLDSAGITGGIEAMYKREHVRFDEVLREWQQYYLAINGLPFDQKYLTAAGGWNFSDVVPYKWCSDSQSSYGSVECQTWDKGTNYEEIIDDYMNRYDSYYIMNNFRRDRTHFGRNYIGRIYSRYLEPLSNVYRYTLYTAGNMGRDKNGRLVSFQDFPIGRDWVAAGMKGMNYLHQILQQPEPGQYCLEVGATGGDIYRPLAAGDTCASNDEINVPLGVGKYYETRWTDEYEYKPTRMGTYFDKWVALYAMTTSDSFFYRDVSSLFDVGAYSLSYWSGGLNDEVINAFRWAYDNTDSAYAWRYDPSQGANSNLRFQSTPLIDIGVNTVDMNLKRIQSASSFSLRRMGILYPMVRFNSAFDYSADFLDYGRICIEGNRDCLDLDTGLGVARYTDPVTGYTYIASRSDNASRAIAADLLDKAATYATVHDGLVTDYDSAVSAFDVAFAADPTDTALVAGGALFDTRATAKNAYVSSQAKLNETKAWIDQIREVASAMSGMR